MSDLRIKIKNIFPLSDDAPAAFPGRVGQSHPIFRDLRNSHTDHNLHNIFGRNTHHVSSHRSVAIIRNGRENHLFVACTAVSRELLPKSQQNGKTVISSGTTHYRWCLADKKLFATAQKGRNHQRAYVTIALVYSNVPRYCWLFPLFLLQRYITNRSSVLYRLRKDRARMVLKLVSFTSGSTGKMPMLGHVPNVPRHSYCFGSLKYLSFQL